MAHRLSGQALQSVNIRVPMGQQHCALLTVQSDYMRHGAASLNTAKVSLTEESPKPGESPGF